MFTECAASSLIHEGGPYYTKRIGEAEFLNRYWNLTKEEVIAIAHQPQDMIKDCRFNGQAMWEPNCVELVQGLVKMFSPKFGVCYMFNFEGINTNRTSVTSIYGGPEFGLQLILDIEGQ